MLGYMHLVSTFEEQLPTDHPASIDIFQQPYRMSSFVTTIYKMAATKAARPAPAIGSIFSAPAEEVAL